MIYACFIYLVARVAMFVIRGRCVVLHTPMQGVWRVPPIRSYCARILFFQLLIIAYEILRSPPLLVSLPLLCSARKRKWKC